MDRRLIPGLVAGFSVLLFDAMSPYAISLIGTEIAIGKRQRFTENDPSLLQECGGARSGHVDERILKVAGKNITRAP
jgi:hypothetical protein